MPPFFIQAVYDDSMDEILDTRAFQDDNIIWNDSEDQDIEPSQRVLEDNWNRIEEALEWQVEQENAFYSPEAIEQRRLIQQMDTLLGAWNTVDHSIPTGDRALDADDEELDDCLLSEAEKEEDSCPTTEIYSDSDDEDSEVDFSRIDFTEEIDLY